MARDYRDLCIEDAVDALVVAEAHVASLAADVDILKATLSVALERLHKSTVKIRRQADTLATLLQREDWTIRQQSGPVVPWYPPFGTPDPPATMPRVDEIRWK